MQSGEIASAQISASSYLDEAHAPGEGRFNGPSAWCAAPAESKPWIKIDLLTHAHIDKFVVHGLVNTPVDYPAASGSYPTELKFKTSVVDDFYSYVDVELQGNSANSAEDVQEYITTWDPVARYIRIKILSSNTAFNCLRVEIYGYMNFEIWPDFNSTHLDDHIEYATDEDIHLECSCFTNPPIETYKEDYYFFLSGTEISNTFCPGHTRQWDTSAVTPSSAWPETGSGLSPVTESATTGFIFTDIFSVDITSPAAHGMTSSSSSSWLCPDVPPDMVFTSTVIYREALTIRGGHVKLNYFLRGDDRTSWTLIMRVWTEITSGSWAHEDAVIAEVHGSPGGGSPGEWREFHHERQFSEKYQLIAVFTIVADGYSMVAIEADSFHLVSDSFIGAKETNLGMQNLNILDRQIASSSERDPNTSAISARLFDGTGWCPDGNDVDPWIQVNMEREVVLNGIMIQGREYTDWVTKYYIRVSNDGDTWLNYDNLDYSTIFEGSWSSNMVVMQTLPNPMGVYSVSNASREPYHSCSCDNAQLYNQSNE
ncbi:uncharacterized protein LOC581731 [Strongylocentrotus purpuratus]|uniref:F5/8 type C domain-containing protein n=1 Tax=Strongylocentrotus purpuratus TaxID=7668 RepID=A0A7M7NJ11_STRPU|nr:uncharacterized protein LOC581731 [Strongylocentrotus purpuratus]